MKWTEVKKELQEGKQVKLRPSGNSMKPLVESKQLVTLDPVDIKKIKLGDIVFCKVNGNYLIHLVTAVGQDGRLQISNNSGHVNGWTKAVYGKVIKVED